MTDFSFIKAAGPPPKVKPFANLLKARPPPQFPKLYTARHIVEQQIIPGMSQERLLKHAKKHGIGKKAGRVVLFTEAEVRLLIEALPCSNSSSGPKANASTCAALPPKASALKKAHSLLMAKSATMHLTNTTDKTHGSVAASGEAAGAPECEVEITPAMIEAGVEAYLPFWCEVRDCDEGAPERMVVEIFKAMAACRAC
jgi:hypothetical protein